MCVRVLIWHLPDFEIGLHELELCHSSAGFLLEQGWGLFLLEWLAFGSFHWDQGLLHYNCVGSAFDSIPLEKGLFYWHCAIKPLA